MGRHKKTVEAGNEMTTSQMSITEMLKREQAEQVERMAAKLKAEREAKERAEREAAEKAEREAAEKAEREAAEAAEAARIAKVEEAEKAKRIERQKAYRRARLEKTYCLLSGLKICMDNLLNAYHAEQITCGSLVDSSEFKSLHNELQGHIFFIKKELLSL